VIVVHPERRSENDPGKKTMPRDRHKKNIARSKLKRKKKRGGARNPLKRTNLDIPYQLVKDTSGEFGAPSTGKKKDDFRGGRGNAPCSGKKRRDWDRRREKVLLAHRSGFPCWGENGEKGKKGKRGKYEEGEKKGGWGRYGEKKNGRPGEGAGGLSKSLRVLGKKKGKGKGRVRTRKRRKN